MIIVDELYLKYARVLLEKGVNLQKNQPLLISAPIEAIDFVRLLTKIACEMGTNDIYFDWDDAYIQHSLL